MTAIRDIPAAPPSFIRPASTRPYAYTDRSLLALVLAPRMTQATAAQWAQGCHVAPIVSLALAWALAAMVLVAFLGLAGIYATAINDYASDLYPRYVSRVAHPLDIACNVIAILPFIGIGAIRIRRFFGLGDRVLGAVRSNSNEIEDILQYTVTPFLRRHPFLVLMGSIIAYHATKLFAFLPAYALTQAFAYFGVV